MMSNKFWLKWISTVIYDKKVYIFIKSNTKNVKINNVRTEMKMRESLQ